MFSYSRINNKDFKVGKVLGGSGSGDSHSYRILYAGMLFNFYSNLGPDPADSSRYLVKKVFRTNEKTYFYEDVRLDVKNKTVHSKSH